MQNHTVAFVLSVRLMTMFVIDIHFYDLSTQFTNLQILKYF